MAELRMDYDGRTDDQPVYVGEASDGTTVSSIDWTIQKIEYDGSDRATRIQIRTGAWTSRTTLGWT